MNEGCEALVAQLAAPYRAVGAYRALLGRGFDALPVVRDGLRHESADVRLHCCRFLDHFLAPEVLDDLIAMLADPDHRVRCSVLHTLACDRCKEGSCRPDKARVLPGALGLLVIPTRTRAPWRSRWSGAKSTPTLAPRPRCAGLRRQTRARRSA